MSNLSPSNNLIYSLLLVVIGFVLMNDVHAHSGITRSGAFIILSILFGISVLVLSGILLLISFIFPKKIASIIRKITVIFLLLSLLLVFVTIITILIVKPM